MPKAEFDRQGKYLWHLMKVAGWDQVSSPQRRVGTKGHKEDLPTENTDKPEKQLTRFEWYLLRTFKVTHYNALNEDEIRRAIATLKPYADKARFDACKGFRQQMMALVAKRGRDKDWLHANMKAWGFGESLRDLGFAELVQVRGLVMKALGVETVGEPGRRVKC